MAAATVLAMTTTADVVSVVVRIDAADAPDAGAEYAAEVSRAELAGTTKAERAAALLAAVKAVRAAALAKRPITTEPELPATIDV